MVITQFVVGTPSTGFAPHSLTEKRSYKIPNKSHLAVFKTLTK